MGFQYEAPTVPGRLNYEALLYDMIAFVACVVSQIVVGSRTEKCPCVLARALTLGFQYEVSTFSRHLNYVALLDDMIAFVASAVTQIVVSFRTEKCPCVLASSLRGTA